MKKIFIKKLNRLIELDNPLICIKFEEPIVYREFVFDIFENMIFSENNNEIDLNKYGQIIYNPYGLSLTEKKLVSALYNILQKNIKDEEMTLLSQIEKNLIELLDNLFQKITIPFEFDENIDINKLFSCIGVKYPVINKNSYFENLMLFIRIYTEVLHIKCFITLNLTNLLSVDEKNKLNSFLNELDIVLIDCFVSEKSQGNDLIVDSEWCSI